MKKRIIIPIAILVLTTGAAFAVFLKTAYVAPVLMYHSIDHNDKMTKLSVSPESFERQMKFLHDNRYNAVTLERIASYIANKEKVPPRTVAITFDDGFYNNYQYAYPVLKKYNIPATIFVITDKVGKPGWLGWKEIRQMSDSGLVTIGSHTRSHLWLPSFRQDIRKKELEGSKDILEKKLGRKVELFCYPVGAFDERVKKDVKAAGYICAVATNPGRFAPSGDVYKIKRIKISRTSDNLFVFWIETSGYYTWVKEHRDE